MSVENKPIHKERDSNIELLRIVLMFMIILFHLIAYGCDLKAMSSKEYISTSKDGLLIGLFSFTTIAVNCFIFISGYYGIKFKMKTFISFLVQAIFYSVIIYFLFSIFSFEGGFSFSDFIKSFFPLSYSRWWFFNVYIGLYILSPLVNKGIDYLNKYQLAGLIIILIYLETGYLFTSSNFYSGDGLNLYTLFVVYLIGRFCGKYSIKISKPEIIFLISWLIIFLFLYIMLYMDKQGLGWRTTAYNSVFVILGAVSFFYIFKKIKIQNKLFNKLAPLIFGIYLIHESHQIRFYLVRIMRYFNESIESSFVFLLVLLIMSLTIFTIGAFIEKVRQIICYPIVNFIDTKIVTPLIGKAKNCIDNL